MHKITTIVKIILFSFISCIVIVCGLYIFAFITPKTMVKTANKFYVYDSNEELVHQGSSTNKWVELKNISPNLINAIISIEDKNFYSHQGFDYLRIAKALFLNLKNGYIVQGASTISQQYIKNLYLDFDKTWKRKIEEAYLTLELEVHYNKDDILEGYLNTINFGQGNYGIENASLFYFNKSSKDLSLEEAIILAGIPKNPTNYNPITNYDKSIERAKKVALAMVKNKYINNEEYESLFVNDIEIYGLKNNNLQTLMYYQDAVMEELKSLNNYQSIISNKGIKIFTNLDINAQTYLEDAIKNNVKDTTMEVASILIKPEDGGVIALTGGKNYNISQYNRAIKAKRQVGSTIKPILYYGALENGMTSSSTFLSEPTTFIFDNNKTYAPKNYNNIYANKPITMAAALAYSDNIYAVKTHLFLGEDVLVKNAKIFGIQEKLIPNPSLALGSNELTMKDFANAYIVLASGGYKNDAFFIRRIEDLDGNILYQKKINKHLIANQNYIYILNELLTATYNNAFIDYNTPTISLLGSQISRKYAMKSGSTDTDYWMVGYNSDALLMVWTGNDDSSDVIISESKISKLIWLNTMENYLSKKESQWYLKPEHVIAKIKNGISGETNNKNNFLFYYLEGTEILLN